MKLEFSRKIFEKYPYLIKILPVGTELFYAVGRTDGHDEANSRFFAILRTRLKIHELRTSN